MSSMPIGAYTASNHFTIHVEATRRGAFDPDATRSDIEAAARQIADRHPGDSAAAIADHIERQRDVHLGQNVDILA